MLIYGAGLKGAVAMRGIADWDAHVVGSGRAS